MRLLGFVVVMSSDTDAGQYFIVWSKWLLQTTHRISVNSTTLLVISGLNQTRNDRLVHPELVSGEDNFINKQ